MTTPELTPTGTTSSPPRTDTRTANNSEPTYSISKVANLYKIGASTLRKRLAAGDLPGAHKLPSRSGESWAIPPTALDAAGIVRKPAVAEEGRLVAVEVAPPAEALASFESVTGRLMTLYEAASRQLEAAESDRTNAREAAAVERTRAEMLAAELDKATKRIEELERRRGWFRRR